MDGRRIPWHGRIALLAVLPAVITLTSCGSGSSNNNSASNSASGSAGSSAAASATGADAKVCQDVSTLRTSITDLKNIPLNKDGLSTLSTKLDQINTQVHQLATDAHSSVQPQIDQLSASVDALKADVQAAAKNPSGTTLSVLPSAVVSVATAAQSVSAALPDC
jgi:hypothetical protein